MFAQSSCKKAEHLQSLPNLDKILQKQSSLIDLIQLSKKLTNAPHLLVQEKTYRMNKGFITNGKRGPNKNAMVSDDNLLTEIWTHIKPELL